MNDDDARVAFEAVLDELRAVVVDFSAIGANVIVVGGQALALEARAAGGEGVIEVAAPTGVTVTRGYSMEPDLLFDLEGAGARGEAILDILKARDFKRVKTARWRKETERGEVILDLFIPPDLDEGENPAGFTRLPAGEIAVLKPRKLKIAVPTGELEIDVPDPVGFIAMKLVAKQRLRPSENKDSFDLYAYVAMRGADVVGHALRSDRYDGHRLMGELSELFKDVTAPGVRDVLDVASTLGDDDRALLAQAVVDLMQEVKAVFDAG